MIKAGLRDVMAVLHRPLRFKVLSSTASVLGRRVAYHQRNDLVVPPLDARKKIRLASLIKSNACILKRILQKKNKQSVYSCIANIQTLAPIFRIYLK